MAPSPEPTPLDPASGRGYRPRSSIGTRSEASNTTYYTARCSNYPSMESNSRAEVLAIIEREPQVSEPLSGPAGSSRAGGTWLISPEGATSMYIPATRLDGEPSGPQISFPWTSSLTSNNSSTTAQTPCTPALGAKATQKFARLRRRAVVLALQPLLRSSSHASTDTSSETGLVGGGGNPMHKSPTRYKSDGNLYSLWGDPQHQQDGLRLSNKPTSKAEPKSRQLFGRAFSKVFGKSKGRGLAENSSPGLHLTSVDTSTESAPLLVTPGGTPVDRWPLSAVPQLPLVLSDVFDSTVISTANLANLSNHTNSINPGNQGETATFDSQMSALKINGRVDTPISRQMTAPEIVSRLVEHGLTDLSSNVEILTFDPSAPGGFSDVYPGELLGRDEVISGKKPYDGIKSERVICLVLRGVTPQRPTLIPPGHKTGDKLWGLLGHCWSFDPEVRPSAADATTHMRAIAQEGVLFQAL